MGQPNPPGDIPLIEGLDSSWNDVVSAFPEDRRSELGSQLKSRVESYEALKPWETFTKAGHSTESVQQAVDVYNILNNNPREVYETIGQYLGITPQQAQKVVESTEGGNDEDDDDPYSAEVEQLKQQVRVLSELQLAQHQQETNAKQAAEQDQALEAELSALKAQHGDFPEQEVLMRMYHLNMTAEEALANYNELADNIRARRPAPTLLGGSGSIPNRRIEPQKLNSQDTRSLVAQMMQAANLQ